MSVQVVHNRWASAKRDLIKKAGLATQKIARDIEAEAKLRAPVDTGFLRNSIHAESVGPLRAVVQVGAEYGMHVEYGTRYMAAQPFLAPAIAVVQKRSGGRLLK